MACEGSYMWTLSGLVAAFLDLAIAYFLLCASAIAFLASKFLGFFGLRLTCPCNGFFGTVPPIGNFCLHRFLIDFPTEQVSNVQLSIKDHFPFNESTGARDQSLNLRLTGGRDNIAHGYLEMDGEASYSSVSDAKKSSNIARIELYPRNEFGSVNSAGERRGRPEMKGKGVVTQRPRGVFRRKRKEAVGYGRTSSVSSYDPPYAEFSADPPSPSSINNEDDGHAPIVMRLGLRDSFASDGFPDEIEQTDKSIASTEELRHNADGELGSELHEKNTIRLLEQSLEKEREARAALCLELEKERNAAATATDEAMAMILRLQEEKASIEMDARQYHRLIEEKSSYEAEEMNILKEILLQTEREKHFLEKEVEVYRQMINLGNAESEVDVGNVSDAQRLPDTLLDPSEDPVLMLHQISASFGKRTMGRGRNSEEVIPIAFGEEAPIQEHNKDACFLKQVNLAENSFGNQEFQEKEMMSIVKKSDVPTGDGLNFPTYSQRYESGISKHKFANQAILLEGEVPNENVGIASKNVETYDGACINVSGKDKCLKYHGPDAYERCPCTLRFDKELHVHDVHVVVDGSNFCNEVDSGEGQTQSGNSATDCSGGNSLLAEATQRIDVVGDCPSTSTSTLDTQVDVKRRSSDIASALPPVGARGMPFPCDLRRNSMSAVVNERMKIENEVEWLRERLKVVQEGREKLNVTVDHREREKLQLKLLEDITRQLHEIRQLTEPGKAVRQASVPLPSKGMSKKRRSRSVSQHRQG